MTHGLIGPGETVTWQGRHFGLMWRHETLITKYDRSRYFQDVMVNGAFRSFVHDHYFQSSGDGGTLMRDELRFAAGLEALGWLAETLLLRRYLKGFLIERNQAIRQVAEGAAEDWGRCLVES